MKFRKSLTRFRGKNQAERGKGPAKPLAEADISSPGNSPERQNAIEALDGTPSRSLFESSSKMSTPETTRAFGLLTLAEPEDAVVDIVFVHGLTGHREKTWRGRHGTEWNKTFLPKDFPNARIMTWGYDANIFHFFQPKKSDNQLDDHSKKLFADLAGARTKNTDRPIIFVAHSLGGIVCENAIVLATINAENHIKEVSACTRGIIFLGTPLRGSSKTKWVDIAQRLARLVGEDKNTNIVSTLKEDAPRLQSVTDDFFNILRDRNKTDRNIEVVFFYEEYPTDPLGHIVSKESATMDGYQAKPIPSDHTGMVQFDRKNDPDCYGSIKEVLERWIENLKNLGKDVSGKGINIYQRIDRMLGGNMIGYITGSPTFNSNVYESDGRVSG